MSRILLVHWNEKEARERSRKLKALGHKTAVLSDTEKRNFESVREFGLGAGWVDYKVCAIDETWSGLCFARRKN
jgi:hypothetical protein